MADLPDVFAAHLGRIAHHAGRVETTLGRLSPGGNVGLSGKQLISALSSAREKDPALAEVIAGYKEQLPLRNRLMHGSQSYTDGMLWVMHVPTSGRGGSMQSYQFDETDLERMATSWRNLEQAAHVLLHLRDQEE